MRAYGTGRSALRQGVKSDGSCNSGKSKGWTRRQGFVGWRFGTKIRALKKRARRLGRNEISRQEES